MSAAELIQAVQAHPRSLGLPVGYAVTVGVACFATLAALTSRGGGPLGNVRYLAGFVINEQPVLAAYWLGAATLLAAVQGDLRGAASWTVAAVAALMVAVLIVLVRRARPAGRVVDRALDHGIGTGWREGARGRSVSALTPRHEWVRFLLPLHVRRRDVRRIANIRYGNAGRANLLDLYLSRREPPSGELRPVLVHLHGGALVMGRKNREGLPLINRLASRGWICISPNYRLRPGAQWPDHLVDVKKVIAWIRAHGPEYGADPHRIFLAGASSGAHLAAVAALTPSDVRFQPGFEEADTSVRGAISLYGHYGRVDAGPDSPPSSPLAYVRPDAPPFFIAHGDSDTVLPASAAREFATALRTRSRSAVVYAELPGAQHQFDLHHSIRCTAVTNGIEAFAAWVLRAQPVVGVVAIEDNDAVADGNPENRTRPAAH